MFNNLTIQGHLIADPVYRDGQNGGKSSCWGKLGVYQGKDQNGNDLDSLFIDFTCFGNEADTLREFAHKGDLIIVSGRFTETKSVGNDGREYINKKVVGNARMCYKMSSQNSVQSKQPVQYAQPQPVQYQQAPQQMNPWG